MPKIKLPNEKKVKQMETQDKELSRLHSLEQEKKVFGKGESLLSRLLRKTKVTPEKKKYGYESIKPDKKTTKNKSKKKLKKR